MKMAFVLFMGLVTGWFEPSWGSIIETRLTRLHTRSGGLLFSLRSHVIYSETIDRGIH